MLNPYIYPTKPMDYDGNEYTPIVIGTQTWLLENLKTTHFRNGVVIPNITNDTQWTSYGETSSQAAYCDYNNSDVNGSKYGHLYNWFAATDSQNIAPTGYHVPTQAEFDTLNAYVSANFGTSLSVGKALAATADWQSDTGLNTVGNNQAINNFSGFSGMPAGARYYAIGTPVSFTLLNQFAAFWTIDTLGGGDKKNVGLYYLFSNFITVSNNRQSCGFSIRCIKD